jgi:hypothetical protein
MSIGFILLLALYFVPSFVAMGRQHHNRGAILLTNVLLGWTFLGWVAALIWSVTAVQQSPQENSHAPTVAVLIIGVPVAVLGILYLLGTM